MSLGNLSGGPTMRQAMWVRAQLNDSMFTTDDVYDVLLGNITSPHSIVSEIETLALDYTERLRKFEE